MKKILLSVAAICATVTCSYGQIENQSAAPQPNSSFYLSDIGAGSAFVTTRTSITAGQGHYMLYNGAFTEAGQNRRWSIGLASPDSTGNYGSDFCIWNYNNTGAYLSQVLRIYRNSGLVDLSKGFIAGSPSMIRSTGTGSSQATKLNFMDTDGITRNASLGIGNGVKDFYMAVDSGNIFITPKQEAGRSSYVNITASNMISNLGNITLNNTTANAIIYGNAGTGAPTINTRSSGTKLVLSSFTGVPNLTDYAMGQETGHIWLSVNSSSNTTGFKFYGGATQVGRIDGLGSSDWNGQGRFRGWYSANGGGASAEIGYINGRAAVIGYDRTTGASRYIPMLLEGGSTANDQTQVLINEVGVGIGTLNPQSKLSVAGIITSQKIKVTQTGWADYVFTDNYQLRSLKEVETFVKSNKHLPGIPTTKEVEKEGLDLGEMNKKLLEKVEELTLYLIEQQKRIEALEMREEERKKTSL